MHKFIDRQDVDMAAVTAHAPHLAGLAERLSAFWADGGADILPLASGVVALANHELERCTALATGLPDACVLIALSDEQAPKLLLTRRAAKLTSHAGEVAFVGGKRDDSDVSSLAVAIREAAEEVALPKDSTTLLGYLPMQISKSGLLVRPVVAAVDSTVMGKLSANADEIDQMFWLPLSTFTEPPVDYVFDRQLLGVDKLMHTPAWVVDDAGGQVIWGLTARMIASLIEISEGIVHPWYYRLTDC